MNDRKHQYKTTSAAPRRSNRDIWAGFCAVLLVVITVGLLIGAGIGKAHADVVGPVQDCSQTEVNVISDGYETAYYEAVASQNQVLRVNEDLRERIADLEQDLSDQGVRVMNMQSKIYRLQDKIQKLKGK